MRREHELSLGRVVREEVWYKSLNVIMSSVSEGCESLAESARLESV